MNFLISVTRGKVRSLVSLKGRGGLSVLLGGRGGLLVTQDRRVESLLSLHILYICIYNFIRL